MSKSYKKYFVVPITPFSLKNRTLKFQDFLFI